MERCDLFTALYLWEVVAMVSTYRLGGGNNVFELPEFEGGPPAGKLDSFPGPANREKASLEML
jgi:hypothetical protein